jgi:hypothetical protein
VDLPAIPETSPRQRVALVGIIVLVIGVSIASHQLTPFAILAALTALIVLGRLQLRGLPVVVAVMIGMWISYMTVAFLAGNLAGLLNDLGAAGQTASQSVGQHIVGSPGHIFVVEFRLAMTFGIWVMAALGAVRRYRWGNLDLDALALAIVPFGLILLQAYGGEILLRVYLFSLPFMAFLAAGLVLPSPARGLTAGGTRWLASLAALLLFALMITKHGNERADYISAAELAGVDHLYALAPPGSALGVVNDATALRFTHFEEYSYPSVETSFLAGHVAAVSDALKSPSGCGYLFLSRSQEVTLEMYGAVPASSWHAAEEQLTGSDNFTRIYQNPDATILLARPQDTACPR